MMRLQKSPVGVAGILAAAIRMVQQTRRRLSPGQRHAQGLFDQRGRHVVGSNQPTMAPFSTGCAFRPAKLGSSLSLVSERYASPRAPVPAYSSSLFLQTSNYHICFAPQ
jgi:hypothetical protein